MKKLRQLPIVSAVSEQCQEIKQALSVFPFFDCWNEKTIAECCRVATVVEFLPDNILLGSNPLDAYSTYFILDGLCLMVEYLEVYVTTKSNGEKKYCLYTSDYAAKDNSKSIRAMYSSMLFNKNLRSQNGISFEKTFEISEENSNGSKQKEEQKKDGTVTSDELSTEQQKENFNSNVYENDSLKENIDLLQKEKEAGDKEIYYVNGNKKNGEVITDNDGEKRKEKTDFIDEMENIQTLKDELEVKENEETLKGETENDKTLKEIDEKEEEIGAETSTEEDTKTDYDNTPSPEREENAEDTEPDTRPPPKSEDEAPPEDIKVKTYEPDFHLKVYEECKKKFRSIKKIAEEEKIEELPKEVERIFVQTGLLMKGACFGLEKGEKDFFVVSRTKVKCLRIPRMFLFQHNVRNVWNRILLFNRLRLVRGEKLLQSVVGQRKWTETKKAEVQRALHRKLGIQTRKSAVPVSVRLGIVPEGL